MGVCPDAGLKRISEIHATMIKKLFSIVQLPSCHIHLTRATTNATIENRTIFASSLNLPQWTPQRALPVCVLTVARVTGIRSTAVDLGVAPPEEGTTLRIQWRDGSYRECKKSPNKLIRCDVFLH